MRVSAKRVGLAAVGLAALIIIVLAAFTQPIRFDSAWTEATRAKLERSLGLTIRLNGPVDVTFFPRPMLVARDVSIGVPGSTIFVEAPVVRGTLSPAAMLRGRTSIGKIEFDDATGWLDVDALPGNLRATSPSTSTGNDDLTLPGTIVFASAVFQLRSVHAGLSGYVSDLHLLLDGLGGGSASVSAGASWHGEHADLTGRLDSFSQFVQGNSSSGSFKLKSRVISGSVAGVFADGWRGGFNGKVAASAPDLAGLLRLAGLPRGIMAGIGHFAFSGAESPTQDGMAFEDAHVTVNDDTLEGTLGVQMEGNRLALVGTLATEKLDIGSFVATLPPVRGPDGGWNSEPIPFAGIGLHDTDLRLSVGEIVLDGIRADDVALSLLCRNGHMELSLGEARAFSGLVKARLFATGDMANPEVRTDLSWSQVDLAALSRALPETAGQLAGSTSGYVSAEGVGPSMQAIVRALSGKGQASWRQGQVPSSPALDAIMDGAGTPTDPNAALTFDLATAGFTIAGGQLSVDSGTIAKTGQHTAVSGQIELAGGRYSLSLTPKIDNASAATEAVQPVHRIAGTWGETVRQLAPYRGAEPGSVGTQGTVGERD